MFDGIWNGFLDMIMGLFYSLLVGILKILDFFVTGFQVFAGVGTVKVQGETQEQNLPLYLFNLKTVRDSFWLILGIGLALMTFFTIIAILKSNYEQQKNWRTVLGKSAAGCFSVILVPLGITLGLLLSGAIITGIQTAISGANPPQSIGGMFLKTMVLEAAGTARAAEVNANFDGYLTPNTSGMDYANVFQVESSLKNMGLGFRNLSTFTYIIAAGILVVSLGLSSFQFVKRIFNIILLYIVSPIVGSTYPLDDGSRFKSWINLVVSTLLSAMGILIVMNLFLLFIPEFFKISMPNQPAMFNAIIPIFLMIAGGFAVLGGIEIISQLTGSEQGSTGAGFLKQLMMGRVLGGVAKLGGKGLGKVWKAAKKMPGKAHVGLARLFGGKRAADFVKYKQDLAAQGKKIADPNASAMELENSAVEFMNSAEDKEKEAETKEQQGDHEDARKARDQAYFMRKMAGKQHKAAAKKLKKEDKVMSKAASSSWTKSFARHTIGDWRAFKADVKEGGLGFALSEDRKHERKNQKQYASNTSEGGRMSDYEVNNLRKEAVNRWGDESRANEVMRDNARQAKDDYDNTFKQKSAQYDDMKKKYDDSIQKKNDDSKGGK